MQIILYTLVFLIGIFFGSFFTLAIHRLPLKQDIIHTRSYCPSCNHRLEFLDLFPIFSYIFLHGKCRYCKEKIGSRYFVIELCSGILFLLFIISLKINVFNLNVDTISYIAISFINLSTLLIIAGIALKNNSLQKSVAIFGLIINVLYIIYLYIVNNINIYIHIIYVILMFIILITEKILFENKNKKTQNYNIIAYFCFAYIITVIIYNLLYF